MQEGNLDVRHPSPQQIAVCLLIQFQLTMTYDLDHRDGKALCYENYVDENKIRQGLIVRIHGVYSIHQNMNLKGECRGRSLGVIYKEIYGQVYRRKNLKKVTSPRTGGTAGVSEQVRVLYQGWALWHHYILLI